MAARTAPLPGGGTLYRVRLLAVRFSVTGSAHMAL
jgi:hypothetical protein